jgi:hypothetical protein
MQNLAVLGIPGNANNTEMKPFRHPADALDQVPPGGSLSANEIDCTYGLAADRS